MNKKNKEGVLLNNDGVDDVLEDGKGDESVVSIWSVLKKFMSGKYVICSGVSKNSINETKCDKGSIEFISK